MHLLYTTETIFLENDFLWVKKYKNEELRNRHNVENLTNIVTYIGGMVSSSNAAGLLIHKLTELGGRRGWGGRIHVLRATVVRPSILLSREDRVLAWGRFYTQEVPFGRYAYRSKVSAKIAAQLANFNRRRVRSKVEDSGRRGRRKR